MKSLKRGLKALVITFLAYLVQVCVMPYLPINGVSGSVVFAVIAVLTVSCGKKYAFCASCLIGMMMEAMVANVPGLYVIAYPVIAMLAAQAFADMTDRQLEQRRMRIEGRQAQRSERGVKAPWWQRLIPETEGDWPAHLRIPLCAGLMDLLLNLVLVVYMRLIGEDLGFVHVVRTVTSVAYTMGIAVILMVPLRYVLRMYRRRPKPDEGGELL